MKRMIIGTSLTAALLLAGCGEESAVTTKEDKTTVKADDKTKTAAKEAPKEKEESADGNKVEKSELGEKRSHFTNKNLNVSTKLGPINFKINKVQTSVFKPVADYKEMFDNKDEVTLIAFEVEAENTSDATINFHPNQAKLTTNTGEQIDASMVLSEDVGGEFIGKVKKKGNVIFLAESAPDKITAVKFIADGPNDENFESLADRYTVDVKTK
ncbi:hypothetical protein [Exiguobacterium sp. S22-S28]|uniref:hypothetical protein n=1 Tax=Exiguobacterium sp. S22-S28 TaxID=3342768 RepID=UPI00372D7118